MDFDLIMYAKDGSLRLPIGYRFDPTDEVLLEYHYLKKVHGQ